MWKHRVALLAAGLLAIGTTTAVAQQLQTPSVTELARGKITTPISIETTGPSDVVMLKVVHDPAGPGSTWHSHPAHFISVKAGSVTIQTGDASGCTSKTYTAGQGFWAPAGAAHVHESTPDAEVLVTYAGLSPGAALSKDEAAPTGPNCTAKLANGIARTELGRGTIQDPFKVTASGESDMLMQSVTIPPGQALRDWFSSPVGIFAVQKSGKLTIFRGNSTACTSQVRSAGEATFVPANEPIFVRNDGTEPSEVLSTRIGLAVGAAPRVDAQNPGGAGCPSFAAASTATPSPASQLPRTGDSAADLLMLSLGLTSIGAVLRRFSRRR